MKKLIAVLLCILILSSCSQNKKASSSSFVTLDDELYLNGLEPSELGLEFAAPADMPLLLSPTAQAAQDAGEKLNFPTSFLFNTAPKVRIYPTASMSYIGCMQAVFVRMQQMGADKSIMDGVYVLNFQLYSSEEFKDGMYAKIYDMNIPYSELEKRVIYNDTGYVAVDVTDYMLGNDISSPVTLEEHIKKRWPNGHPDEEYAFAMRDYVKENMGLLLTKIQQP